MSLLLNKLPQFVNIGGTDFKINSDFRISICFEQLMQDITKDDNEIFSEALRMYYPEIDIIPDTQEAVNQMLWFYRCGKELKETKKKSDEIYSFEHDSDYIYSAFLDQYKTDLQEIKYLHWWKFKAMFTSLKEDNEISKIMSIRATDASKLSKEQKEHYRKLKKIYALPRPKKEVEVNNAFEQALLNGGDISKLL